MPGLYNGYSAPHPENRKKYTRSAEERAARKAEKAERDGGLDTDVTSIFTTRQDAAATAAAKWGVPKTKVDLMLGSKGAELSKARPPTAFNGWQSAEMGRINEERKAAGLKAMNVEAFLNEYGDDYLALGKEERDFYCGLLAEERAERTTAIRKVGKHALADINATLQSISSAATRNTERTGQGWFIMSVKMDHDSPGPAAFFITPKILKFCNDAFKLTPEEVLHLLEAFAVRGVEGLAKGSEETQSALRELVVKKIATTLFNATGHKIKMSYLAYHKSIVKKRKVHLVALQVSELRTILDAFASKPPSLFWVPIDALEVQAISAARFAYEERGEDAPQYISTVITSRVAPTRTTANSDDGSELDEEESTPPGPQRSSQQAPRTTPAPSRSPSAIRSPSPVRAPSPIRAPYPIDPAAATLPQATHPARPTAPLPLATPQPLATAVTAPSSTPPRVSTSPATTLPTPGHPLAVVSNRGPDVGSGLEEAPVAPLQPSTGKNGKKPPKLRVLSQSVRAIKAREKAALLKAAAAAEDAGDQSDVGEVEEVEGGPSKGKRKRTESGRSKKGKENDKALTRAINDSAPPSKKARIGL